MSPTSHVPALIAALVLIASTSEASAKGWRCALEVLAQESAELKAEPSENHSVDCSNPETHLRDGSYEGGRFELTAMCDGAKGINMQLVFRDDAVTKTSGTYSETKFPTRRYKTILHGNHARFSFTDPMDDGRIIVADCDLRE